MFGRRQVRTHNDMMRDEFTEGMDHLRMAGAHAAGSVAEMIAPRMDVMRERMIEPAIDKSMDMARDGARRAGVVARRATGKKSAKAAKRWPRMLGGLMIAGATLGAASALLSRRRQRKWNEYESTGTAFAEEEARSVAESARAAASSMTEKAKEKASDVMGQMKEATDTSPSSGAQATATSPSSGAQAVVTPPSTGESLTGGSTTGSGSRNGRP